MIGEIPLRVTLFVMHPGEGPPPDQVLVLDWLKKWDGVVTLTHHSTGGWEDCWDIEAPLIALREIPKRLFCLSDWATYPQTLTGPAHKGWRAHYDDGNGDVEQSPVDA